jgi:Pentapeptide repeats (8 copies)
MQEYPSSSMSSSNPPDAEMWQAYWREQGQPWRSEPIIDEERQQRLLSYAQGGVDIERGRYPFKGVRLSRADIEWLLAMQEQRSAQERAGGGTRGKQQKSFGLDVRGADLSGVNLRDLPLMRLHAGLSLEEGRHATTEQSRQASANLTKADVSQAQLQGAQLSWATLDEAVLPAKQSLA